MVLCETIAMAPEGNMIWLIISWLRHIVLGNCVAFLLLIRIQHATLQHCVVAKVKQIIQLEYEVHQMKDQLEHHQHYSNENDQLPSFNHSLVELMKVDAECKSLWRQNMMLKLVVEELQEAHKHCSESDIDVDSVFMKLPKEMQLGHHHNPALGAITTSLDFDDELEMTDFFNIGK